MEVDIKSIGSYWLTCQKSKDRWDGITNDLKSIGVVASMLDGEITTPYTVGVAKNHLRALVGRSGPVLILEDDARLNPKAAARRTVYTIPDDTDALYLGTSLYGRVGKGETILKGALSFSHSNMYLRIFNMLSLHAVLYISDKYKKHVINLLNDFIKNPIGGMDDRIAETMWRYNVLALRTPIFFQNDGHSEFATTTKLCPILE